MKRFSFSRIQPLIFSFFLLLTITVPAKAQTVTDEIPTCNDLSSCYLYLLENVYAIFQDIQDIGVQNANGQFQDIQDIGR